MEVKYKYRTVAIPTGLAERGERLIMDHPELGYRSLSELTIDSLRRRLDELENSHRPPRGEEAVEVAP